MRILTIGYLLCLTACTSMHSADESNEILARVNEFRAESNLAMSNQITAQQNAVGARRNQCVSAGAEPDTDEFAQCIAQLEKRDARQSDSTRG